MCQPPSTYEYSCIMLAAHTFLSFLFYAAQAFEYGLPAHVYCSHMTHTLPLSSLDLVPYSLCPGHQWFNWEYIHPEGYQCDKLGSRQELAFPTYRYLQGEWQHMYSICRIQVHMVTSTAFAPCTASAPCTCMCSDTTYTCMYFHVLHVHTCTWLIPPWDA